MNYLIYEVDDEDQDAKEFKELLDSISSRSGGDLPKSQVMCNVEDDEIPWICPESPIIPLYIPTQVIPPTPAAVSARDRFEVQIIPCNRQVAQWDLQDGDVFAWPALLCIKDKHFSKNDLRYGYEYDLTPPIRSLRLSFRTAESLPLNPQERQYAVAYTGQTLAPHLVPTHMVTDRGICIESTWHRGPFPNPLRELGTENAVDASYVLKFHVPVPAWLFAGHECRVFRIESRVEVSEGDGEYRDEGGAYEGSTQVMIEHLRSEVLMEGCKSFSRRIS